MPFYVNCSNVKYAMLKHSDVFVDKSGLLSVTNRAIAGIGSGNSMCVTRPRRFGKTAAINMLNAYYSRGCDSRELFDGMEISKDPNWEEYINSFNVIRVDVQSVAMRYKDRELVCKTSGNTQAWISFTQFLKSDILREMKIAFPSLTDEESDLSSALVKLYDMSCGKRRFIMLLDEWDFVFREWKDNLEEQNYFLDFLRGLFKSDDVSECFALVYMTGILPIKRYNAESALNNFYEYTMLYPDTMAPYIGFNENEVKALCDKYFMKFDEMKLWYDGYHFKNTPFLYNPNSVVQAIRRHRYNSYWEYTGSFESILTYLDLNLYGIQDALVSLLGGSKVRINPAVFQNDLREVKSKDSALTVLVHLGYLTYEEDSSGSGGWVSIPNREIRIVFKDALTGNLQFHSLAESLAESSSILEATLTSNSSKVAEGIQAVHERFSSLYDYNSENSLRCVISLAYYTAQDFYDIRHEEPSGRGRAYLIFYPKPSTGKPPIVMELKWNKSEEDAIAQIKRKNYISRVKDYRNAVLVGISYDEDTGKHSCKIERIDI